MTELELKQELDKVKEVIEKVKITRDIIVKAHEVQQLLVIYNTLKQVYPSVHFQNPSGGGCGSCVYDFLQQIIPIFDRLSASEKSNQVEKIVNPFNPEGYDENQIDNPNIDFQLEENSGLYKAVIKEESTPKNRRGRKKK